VTRGTRSFAVRWLVNATSRSTRFTHHVSLFTFHSLFRLNPNQSSYPKRKRQAREKQGSADDRFHCAQLFRTHKRRLPVFDSGNVKRHPVRRYEPDYESDGKTEDSSQ
jgi:hypothetical protein